MADLKIVITALNKASGDLNKLKQDMTGVKDAGDKGGLAVKGFGDNISGMISNAAMAAGIVAGVGLALKEVYDSAKEAAELDYAAARFDNLATSIGTTSDALLTDMKAATDGMVSDAELVASAGNLMALGLADTHEEVVRLTTVAGALGMNMNQLVLTLTNQTTMRFDALGVSVVGFDEKVKALEESGLSAQEAFSEAFLQQAEEQILKVGSASDYAIGDIKRFEASIQNVGNSAKEALIPIANEILPKITEGFDNLNRTQLFKRLSADIEEFGLDIGGLTAPYETFFGQFVRTDESLIKQMDLFNKWANTTYNGYVKNGMGADEARAKVIELYNTYGVGVFAAQDWADANYDGGTSATRAGIAVAKLNKELEEAKFSMEEYMESVTGTEAKFKFLNKNSGTYSELLTEIEAKQAELADMAPWEKASESGRELQGEVDTLIAKLEDLGEAMKMDALKTAIEANGDVTEKEYQMMLDYMENAGLINKETNKEMMKDWRELNNFQQSLRWDAEGNLILIADEALKTVEELKEAIRGIERHIGITVNVSQMGQLPTGRVRISEAVGGAVYGGNPYTWQEYGYKGELFVPSSDGFIMSRADAERALSKALTTGGDGMDAEAIGKAVAKALSGVTKDNQKGGNVYNLTMPTSSNPADVRTAFELMEAWNA